MHVKRSSLPLQFVRVRGRPEDGVRVEGDREREAAAARRQREELHDLPLHGGHAEGQVNLEVSRLTRERLIHQFKKLFTQSG